MMRAQKDKALAQATYQSLMEKKRLNQRKSNAEAKRKAFQNKVHSQ